MSIGIQFRSSTLIRIIAGELRRIFRRTCFPGAPGISVDHLQVVKEETTLVQKDSAVELRIPVDVFLVSDADLFKNSNGTPAGALTPAARVLLPFRVTVDSEALRLAPLPPESKDIPAPLLAALSEALTTQPIGVPLGPLVEALRQTGLPDTSDVVAGDGIVAGRFAARGPAKSRLMPGQDWGLFIGADAVVGMIRNLIEPQLTGALKILEVKPTFRHGGGTPGVGLKIGSEINVLGLGLGIAVSLDSVLRLLAGPPPVLRINASWGVDIDTSLLVPFFGIWALAAKPVAEAAAREIISSALDVTRLGGTPTGQTSFFLDTILPPLAFGSVTLRYDSLTASVAGMVLGGAAIVPTVADPPFRLRVSTFGRPSRIQRCRDLAKTGSAAPSREPPTIHNTTVYAVAEVEGAGRFCEIQMRSPDQQWRNRIRSPADETTVEDFKLEAELVFSHALALQDPLSFVLRTPCGVRFIDFGRPPPPQTDENGRLTDVIDAYIDNCLHVVPLAKGRWGIGWQFDKEYFRPRPPEEPGWAEWLKEARGVDVQLVRLRGLDPGEMVRFRSDAHTIEAIADATGSLVLPVLRANREDAGPALLERADGRSLEDHVSFDSAVFEPVANMAGTLMGKPANSATGAMQLDVQEQQGPARYILGAYGLTRTNLSALNPQPLPPVDTPQHLPPDKDSHLSADGLQHAGILGVRQVFTIPGFAGSSVAVARLDDGSKLLLDLAGKRPRVSGVVRGPFGELQVVNRPGFTGG